jgi:hypothetical protein
VIHTLKRNRLVTPHFQRFLKKWALLKPFRILAYVALIEGRNNVWGYKLRVSTEPKNDIISCSILRLTGFEYIEMT